MSHPARRSDIGYRPELDGVRGVAGISIVLFHHSVYVSNWKLVGAYIGVDLFFVLSGYLITTLLLEEERGLGKIFLGGFYARRALRLLPALIVALGVGAVAVSMVGSNVGGMSYGKSALAALSYGANWFAAAGISMGVIAHLWSLSVEEQYYLLWPISLRVLRERLNIGLGLIAGAMAVVALLVVVLRWFTYGRYGLDFAFYSTFTRCDAILFGSALGILLHDGGAGWLRRILRIQELAIAAAVVTAALMLRLGIDRISLSFGLLLAEVCFLVIVGHVAMHNESIVSWCMRRRPLPYLGRISYGLYLFHLPVSYVVHGFPPRRLGWPYVALSVAISIAVASISFRFIELRALRLKDRFRPTSMRSGTETASTHALESLDQKSG